MGNQDNRDCPFEPDLCSRLYTDGMPVASQDHSKWAVTFLGPPPPHDVASSVDATSRKLLGGAAAARRGGGGGGDGYPKSVCIGDINRAGHQLQRGGGTVCFVANDALWESFSGIVETWDKCHAQRST